MFPTNTGYRLWKNRGIETEIFPRVEACLFGELLGGTLKDISENMDFWGQISQN